MVKHSAGIALLRPSPEDQTPELLVVHPGGPFWRGKNQHAWSIPKGEFDPALEAAVDCAIREFREETGHEAPAAGDLMALAVVKASGKHIHAFMGNGDFDPSDLVSNTTEIEWPPRSGERITIPEVDAAAWVRLDDAEQYLHKGQARIAALIREEFANREPDS